MGLTTEAVHVHDPAVPFFAVGIVHSAETCRDLQELQYVHQQIDNASMATHGPQLVSMMS